MEQPRFYFDLGSPAAYLVAERVLHALPELAEWVPVHFGADPAPDRAALEARAAALGALPFRWPAAWPPDTAYAMRAATYAKGLGKTVGFCQAAFRQAYAGGRDLGDPTTVFLAGAAAEMHPAAIERAVGLRTVRAALDAATAGARAAGVTSIPALVLRDGRVVAGADCVEEAAAA